jgi:hypothetical protein
MPQDFTTGQVLTAAQMDTLSAAVDGYATTATAAGTTTLTTASMYQQFFTGSTTQTVTMPVASTLYVGQKFRVVNNSSGVVTAQSSGANTIYAIPAGGDVIFTCILASGTSAASWDYKNATAAASAGGKVLQVVTATYSTQTNSSSTSFADTGLTATITPSATSSKILMIASISFIKSGSDTNQGVFFKMLRASTAIADSGNLGYTGSALAQYGQWSNSVLDSPSSTSALIYKVQFAANAAAASVSAQANSSTSSIVLLEIGA